MPADFELPIAAAMAAHAAAGLVVAALGIPADITDQQRALLTHLLLPRQDAAHCATGCKLQKLCLRPPSPGVDGDPMLWNGWGTRLMKQEPCADGLEASLCTTPAGKVCEDPEGIDAADEDDPVAAIERSLTPGQCRSIVNSTTDAWCVKAFGKVPDKAKDSRACRCLAPAPAPPSAPAPSCDASLWPKGSKPACLSITGAHDEWCQDTCKSCASCPLSECRCGSEVEAEIAQRKQEAKLVCNFEAEACEAPPPSGAAPLCKTCADHITSCLVIPRLDEEGNQVQPLDECLHEIARKPHCRTCNSTESAHAFRVRYWPQALLQRNRRPTPEPR